MHVKEIYVIFIHLFDFCGHTYPQATLVLVLRKDMDVNEH